jgi:hypothetical protein
VSLGWLWFDNDPKTGLEEKIAQAAGRFQQKFGQPPRLCYVNERALTGVQATCGRTRVLGATNVRPGHFLFVVEAPPPTPSAVG